MNSPFYDPADISKKKSIRNKKPEPPPPPKKKVIPKSDLEKAVQVFKDKGMV